MKKIILTLLVAMAAATGAHAQIFWKVTGKDAKNTSYILGTHHLAPLSVLDSIKSFAPSLNEVDAVIGEVDMSDMAKKAQSLSAYMMAPADSTLTALLTPAQADSVTTVFQQFLGPQISVQHLAPLKPAAVSTQLAMLEAMKALDPAQAQALAQGQQLDTEVQNRARALSKDILGFETLEQQMEILMGGSLTHQAENLMKAIAESMSGKATEKTRKLTEYYLAHDYKGIEEMIYDEEETDISDLGRMIVDRNIDWANQLADILPSRQVLIAVGAGHLPGEKGLIALLRQAGYTVTPIE